MAWPKGRARPKKVGSSDAPEPKVDETTDIPDIEREASEPPSDWRKGELLNVRNYGDAYIVTRFPEEYRPEHEERAMRFTNPARCQDFVSNWYAREHCDPRAR